MHPAGLLEVPFEKKQTFQQQGGAVAEPKWFAVTGTCLCQRVVRRADCLQGQPGGRMCRWQLNKRLTSCLVEWSHFRTVNRRSVRRLSITALTDELTSHIYMCTIMQLLYPAGCVIKKTVYNYNVSLFICSMEIFLSHLWQSGALERLCNHDSAQEGNALEGNKTDNLVANALFTQALP